MNYLRNCRNTLNEIIAHCVVTVERPIHPFSKLLVQIRVVMPTGQAKQLRRPSP